jgi:CheY-like chemotaxis protein
VRLFFPLSATSAPSSTEEPMVVPSTASGGVLLVDDDQMLRELGRRMLERLGDLTYVMASAEEAVEFLAARAAEVSLVVTDLTMPGMSGLDLLAHLAERYPDLPAVAISGFAVNPDARALLAAQRVPYVAKPFTIQELAAAMAMARGRRTG